MLSKKVVSYTGVTAAIWFYDTGACFRHIFAPEG